MGGTSSSVCACCTTRRPGYGYEQDVPMYLMHPRTSQPLGYQAAPPVDSHTTGTCIVCRETSANTACLPCGHLLVCFRCSLRYVLADGCGVHPDTRCPCCKESVKSFQRVFLQAPSISSRPPAEPSFGDAPQMRRPIWAI
eukprot:TRINITY_DN79927_c0_g1_i1.p1 TRINITY_DN79927_c0_g1~~TRINITY_DN79927_c0_g1_i1.p1  ORF type:complete len:154 (+),score=12.26 TRINITY_DN79927_c0_g1_i1:45-464(+)